MQTFNPEDIISTKGTTKYQYDFKKFLTKKEVELQKLRKKLKVRAKRKKRLRRGQKV